MRTLAQVTDLGHDLPAGIFSVDAYIHTVEAFFSGLHKRHRDYARIAELGEMRSCGEWGYIVWRNRPTRRWLKRLRQRMWGYADYSCLHRVDVAVDYHGREQELLHDFVACSIILRHRRQQPMHDYRGTVYWCRARKKLGRNLVLYSDKGCVHLELRLLTAHAVRHAGISGVDDLLRLNPQHILKRYLKQSSCGLRHAHASIRHQAQKTAQRLRQKPDLDGFSRAYERNKPNWLQGLLHRLHYDRAQVIALTRPKMAKLKEEQTILDIIPIKLTPPMQWGYGGRDGLGERDQGGRGDHLGDIISIGAQGG